jgi:hypothetical protein
VTIRGMDDIDISPDEMARRRGKRYRGVSTSQAVVSWAGSHPDKLIDRTSVPPRVRTIAPLRWQAVYPSSIEEFLRSHRNRDLWNSEKNDERVQKLAS